MVDKSCSMENVVVSNGHHVCEQADDKLKAGPVPEAKTEAVNGQADEVKLLTLMRESVEKLDPESKNVDDATLRRFLRARSSKVDKATKMFVEHQKWRRSFVPNGYIDEAVVANELGTNKVLMQGTDKLGRPVCVILAAKHNAYKRNLDEFKRYVAFNFDKVVASMPPGVEKFTVIVDFQDLGYKNLDPRGWIYAFDFLQAYYPERLGRLFMVHVPAIFWAAWKIVNPFIDKVTKDKILFVDDKTLLETLLQDIDKEQLPISYGGLKQLVPIQNAPTPNWPPPTEAASVLDSA